MKSTNGQSPPKPEIDVDYLWSTLLALLDVPSPTGYTDEIVRVTVGMLEELGIKSSLTRRGAIRADLPSKKQGPARAVVAHLDTLGAMVRRLKSNGRLALAPIGTWSSRFAEGARVSIFAEGEVHRGTVLPLKASGHVYGDEVDTQPVSWDAIEVRVDAPCESEADLAALGIHVGTFLAFDPTPEVTSTGYINSRHLDDKAGVASMLTMAKALVDAKLEVPLECHLLFTISEEVGSGASSILHGDVAEMVAVDNATHAPGQATSEKGVTVACMDSAGPFDFHLTRRMLNLCDEHSIPNARDVFIHYRCDAAAAIEAGNDLRTALVCFGADGSHGYERVHVDSMVALSQLLYYYVASPPVIARDRRELAPLEDFPRQPTQGPPGRALVPDDMPS